MEMAILAVIIAIQTTVLVLALYWLRGDGWQRVCLVAAIISFGGAIRRSIVLAAQLYDGELALQQKLDEFLALSILTALMFFGICMVHAMFRSMTRSARILQEKEALFRGMVESLPGIVFRCRNDADLTMVYISDTVKALTGFAPEAFIENRVHWIKDLRHPEDAVSPELTNNSLLQNQGYELVYRIRHVSGAYIWAQERGRGEYDENGQLLWINGFIWDVTERKRTEELQRIQHELALAISHAGNLEQLLKTCLRAAIEGAEMDGGGIYLLEPATGAFYLAYHEGLPDDFVNAAYRYEAQSSNVVFIQQGKPTYSSYGTNNLPEEQLGLKEQLRAIAIVPVLHNGEVIACLNVASHRLEQVPDYARTALETLSGQIGQAIARERAEIAHREREENLATFFESITDMIFVLDSNACILRINPAVERTLGFASHELIGQPIARVHAESGSDDARTYLLARQEGKYYKYDERLLTRERREIPVETNIVRGRWNGAAAVFLISRDIRERIHAEETRLSLERQVQHSQKLESLGVLAGGIAHDFNNLLMAILGYAELSLEDLDAQAPVRKYIEHIHQTSFHAADLCRQMLAYSGRGRFVTELFCLNETIREMQTLLKASISKKNMLDIRLCDSLLPLEGDPAQVRQVIMNLVINASEAIGEMNGVITLSTGKMHAAAEPIDPLYDYRGDAKTAPCICLEISDTGCGMSQDTLNRLYDPFFTTKLTGRGLGMSAVLGIIRGHKGAVHVHSMAGHGTTFRILLPLSDRELSRKTPEIALSTGWKGQGCVLFVDDEADLLDIGKAVLERLGIEVLTAQDGMEALDIFRKRQQEIDVVLLDMTMPRMDGMETFRELKRLNPGVRVIIASGYSENEIEARFAESGVVGVLQKPYSMNILRDRIQRFFETASSRQE